jgi:hypothetical protein
LLVGGFVALVARADTCPSSWSAVGPAPSASWHVVGPAPSATWAASTCSSAGPPVPGYDLWLDATYGGNTATTWKDLSGNGYDATATGTGTMQLLANECGGKTCYRFSSTGGGGDQPYMITPSYPVSTFVVFAVYRFINPGASMFLPGAVGTTGGLSEYAWSFAYAPPGTTHPWCYVGNQICYASGSPPILDDGVHVGALGVLTTTGYEAWIDGVVAATSYYYGPSPTSTQRTIGFSGFAGNVMYGDIAEVIEYPTALTPAQFALVDEYLGAKWGVTVP